MCILGIDVHKDESHLVVLDDDVEIHDEVRVANADLNEVARGYAGSKAAIEATSNYHTFYDTLDDHLDVVVADPSQTTASASPLFWPDTSFSSSRLSAYTATSTATTPHRWLAPGWS